MHHHCVIQYDLDENDLIGLDDKVSSWLFVYGKETNWTVFISINFVSKCESQLEWIRMCAVDIDIVSLMFF